MAISVGELFSWLSLGILSTGSGSTFLLGNLLRVKLTGLFQSSTFNQVLFQVIINNGIFFRCASISEIHTVHSLTRWCFSDYQCFKHFKCFTNLMLIFFQMSHKLRSCQISTDLVGSQQTSSPQINQDLPDIVKMSIKLSIVTICTKCRVISKCVD